MKFTDKFCARAQTIHARQVPSKRTKRSRIDNARAWHPFKVLQVFVQGMVVKIVSARQKFTRRDY